MATGTGKTYVAFQIIHRLWKSSTKRRILFLADRNALIDQTKRGDFRHFKDKMTVIRKKKIDKSYEIYLALYQGLTNYDVDLEGWRPEKGKTDKHGLLIDDRIRAITELLTELINPKPGERVLDPACGTGGFLTCALEHLKAKAANVGEREAIGKNVTGWEYKPLPYLLGNTNLILHDINLPNIQYDDSLAKPLTEYRQKDRVDIILANPPFGGVVSNNNENNFPQTFRTKESADLFLILMIHLLKDGGRAAIVLPDGSLTGEGVKQRIRQKLLEDCNLHTIIRLPNSVFQPYASVATNLLFFTKGEPTEKIWYWEHKLPENYKAYSKTKPIQLLEFDNVKKWWKKREENEQAWQVDFETIRKNGYNLDIKNPHQPKPEKQYSSAELLDLLHHSFAKGDALLAQLKKGLG